MVLVISSMIINTHTIHTFVVRIHNYNYLILAMVQCLREDLRSWRNFGTFKYHSVEMVLTKINLTGFKTKISIRMNMD